RRPPGAPARAGPTRPGRPPAARPPGAAPRPRGPRSSAAPIRPDDLVDVAVRPAVVVPGDAPVPLRLADERDARRHERPSCRVEVLDLEADDGADVEEVVVDV